MEEQTTDVVERGRESQVEPEDVTDLLPSHNRILMHEEIFLVDKIRKWSSEIDPTVEYAMNMVEKTTKALHYYTNLAHKATAGTEWLAPVFLCG